MIPGFTSTQSKRPAALFGEAGAGPLRMTRASGCRVWDEEGREYLDTIMALGAVALGYAHPAVTAAVEAAGRDGIVGPLPPVLEDEVAERLGAVLPGAEACRFLKTGAEAVAAAVRLARVYTGRDAVITCGYHGWLDWCQDAAGVPDSQKALRHEVPFNDVKALAQATVAAGPIAAIVVEPVIEALPAPEWLAALRNVATAASAVLIFDEIKTAFRVEVGGIAERFGITPDLTVVGKALGNGLPIAAVCGRRDLMDVAGRTWISSTLSTEYVSLAAARAVLDTFEKESAIERISTAGGRFHGGLERLAGDYSRAVTGVRGIPEMCFLTFRDEAVSSAVALTAARRGLLFKRTAYNFMSLAHTDELVDEILARLEAALDAVNRTC